MTYEGLDRSPAMTSLRTRSIALLALLQILLQPLALAAGCSLLPAGSSSCCCSPEPSVVEAGCCASEAGAAEQKGSPIDDCACAPVPEPLPWAPPSSVDEPAQPVAVALFGAELRAPREPRAGPPVGLGALRAPGDRVPLRIRFQVFRL